MGAAYVPSFVLSLNLNIERLRLVSLPMTSLQETQTVVAEKDKEVLEGCAC